MDNVIESTLNGFKADYECEKCKSAQKVNVLPLINFQLNPEYYALVKDLSIFKVRCEKCGAEKLIQFDTLLVDETHKYFLYFLTDKSLYNNFRHQIKYFVETTLNKDDKYDFKDYKTRLVFELNDIVEKMNIFEIGLNDEAIELIKYGLYENNVVNKNIFDRIYFDGMNNADLEFVALSTKTKTKDPMKFTINHSLYNRIVDDLQGFQNRHRDYFEVIDEEWVKSKFSSSQEKADK